MSKTSARITAATFRWDADFPKESARRRSAPGRTVQQLCSRNAWVVRLRGFSTRQKPDAAPEAAGRSPLLYSFVKALQAAYINVQSRFSHRFRTVTRHCAALESGVTRAYDPDLSPGPPGRTSSGGPICRTPRVRAGAKPVCQTERAPRARSGSRTPRTWTCGAGGYRYEGVRGRRYP